MMMFIQGEEEYEISFFYMNETKILDVNLNPF